VTYFKEREQRTLKKLDEIKDELPPFADKFFLAISNITTPLTRLNYAYDLRLFFYFICFELGTQTTKMPIDLTLEDLEDLTTHDVDQFIDWTTMRDSIFSSTPHTNTERGKARKISTLRSFFAYYFKLEQLTSNIMPNINMPKIREKPIIRLERKEIADLIETVMYGHADMSVRQRAIHYHTKVRDLTIMVFLLSTGIRVSELVGLNIGDININEELFRITRKGGKTDILPMPEDLTEQLHDYLRHYLEGADRKVPNKQLALDDNVKSPLFKSLQNQRITVRAVQKLVKKYADMITLKKISPHKLRSTYGTNLYRKTKDIFVVADLLGHKDVNTTRKHYTAMGEDIRREAVDKVRIIDED